MSCGVFLLVFSAFNHIDIYFTFRQKSSPILVPLYIKVEWADAIKQMLPFSMWHANAVTEFQAARLILILVQDPAQPASQLVHWCLI